MQGRKEPEKVTDQQCTHCGLYYTSQGIDNHQANCPLEGHETMIQPLERSSPPSPAASIGDGS